jgi:hypothetical protein
MNLWSARVIVWHTLRLSTSKFLLSFQYSPIMITFPSRERKLFILLFCATAILEPWHLLRVLLMLLVQLIRLLRRRISSSYGLHIHSSNMRDSNPLSHYSWLPRVRAAFGISRNTIFTIVCSNFILSGWNSNPTKQSRFQLSDKCVTPFIPL